MADSCHFSTLILADLFLLSSSILSHPLYLSYIIFFSPYLVKLFSFLSPLFLLTTCLISLAPVLHHNVDEFHYCDYFGMYDILFGSILMEEEEDIQCSGEIQFQNSADEVLLTTDSGKIEEAAVELEKSEDFAADKARVNLNAGEKSTLEEKRRDNFQKILRDFEKMATDVEEKKRLDPSSGGSKSDKVVEKQQKVSISNGSEGAINGAKARFDEEREENTKAESSRFDEEREGKLKAESSRALMAVNSYGSMRVEKEWKRTLACKLFEERHNIGGMDSLWESYETDSNKMKNETKKKTTKKRSEVELIDKYEEEDEGNAQLCCLQAVKLSTGKLNLGVGIPNLKKISKAIKGIGWLSKRSKKVHNNNRRDF